MDSLNLAHLIDSFADQVAARVREKLSEPSRDGKVGRRLFTVEDAAAYLGRTREAVQHMISSGKLPVVRSDRRVFLDVRDLDRWIEDNKLQ